MTATIPTFGEAITEATPVAIEPAKIPEVVDFGKLEAVPDEKRRARVTKNGNHKPLYRGALDEAETVRLRLYVPSTFDGKDFSFDIGGADVRSMRLTRTTRNGVRAGVCEWERELPDGTSIVAELVAPLGARISSVKAKLA